MAFITPSHTLSYLWAAQNLHLTGAFGLLKQKLWRTKFDCLKDIVDTVNNLANVNFAQEVGSQMGEVIVPTYNCQGLFSSNLKKNPLNQKVASIQNLKR